MNIQETRLESWKEIGAYLQRDATTARRWEKEEGLPVHRHSHKSRASVYAYPSEIDAWRASRKVAPEPVPARPLWKIPAFAATMLLCLVMVGNGIRPTIVSAQAQQNRQTWIAGADEDPSESVPSPDGRYIGFTDWSTGELGIRDLTTGQSRHLTHAASSATSWPYAESSAISPDGRQLAYAWFTYDQGTYEVRLISLAGGPPRTLYRGTEKRDYPKVSGWTPDSKQILVVRSRAGTSQLAFISAQDGTVRVLKSLARAGQNARMSPDGRFVAYDSPPDDKTQTKDIFVIATDGSRETPVVQHAESDSMPQWSPDGSRVLFVSDRTGSPSLWSIAVNNGQPKGAAVLVKAEIGQIQLLGINRGGALLYLAPGSSNSNIYTADLGSNANKAPALTLDRFVNSNWGPQISPDGERLAYVSVRGAGAVIVVRDLKTGTEREVKVQFPLRRIYGNGPMWFPDSRFVLVSSQTQRRVSFYRVDVNTGAAELLHRVWWVTGYDLSPDGKAILYTELTPDAGLPSLVRFDLESRRETELKKGESFIAVAVSPDSKQIAYSVQSDVYGGYLATMPASGGESREVFRGSRWIAETLYALTWSPDAKSVIFGQGTGATVSSGITLWRVPVSGGQAEETGVSMPAQLQSLQVHPDGQRIFFSTVEKSPYEVWALENFLPAEAR